MEGEAQKLFKVGIAVIATLCYCFYVVGRIGRGKKRLLSLLPVFYLFTTLPLNFTSFHLRGPALFFLFWLGNFKLLLFAFDQAPLTPLPRKVFHFIAVACLPIKIIQDPPPKPPVSIDKPLNTNKNENPSHQNAETRSRIADKIPGSISLVIKALLLALIIRAYENRPRIHPFVIYALYCCHLYIGLDIILAMSATPARACGFELEPQFNKPYLATSLQDFWGRRWNLMVPNILRPTVYNPVRRFSAHVVGPLWAPLPAVIAVFLVSGLVHEVILYFITHASPTWEWTWFFVIHGVCVVIEILVKKAVTNRWQLHRAVSGPLTIGFLAVTGVWLFFPPIIRNGVDDKVIQEYPMMVDFVKAFLPTLS